MSIARRSSLQSAESPLQTQLASIHGCLSAVGRLAVDTNFMPENYAFIGLPHHDGEGVNGKGVEHAGSRGIVSMHERTSKSVARNWQVWLQKSEAKRS